MAVLRLVGGPLVCASVIAVMFGLIEPGSPSQVIATIPEMAWEASLGIYLIVKGFKASSPLLAGGRGSAVGAGVAAPAAATA
jgi:hypothetical protein